MDTEQRQEAIFGAYDGLVSIIGFIFGLMVHHASAATIAVGGLGGAIAAGVSMGTGEIEKADGDMRARIPVALIMFAACLAGALIPLWPFFVTSGMLALLLAGVGSVIVAAWIGHEKRQGVRGYVISYAILAFAALLTLAVVSVIPSSV